MSCKTNFVVLSQVEAAFLCKSCAIGPEAVALDSQNNAEDEQIDYEEHDMSAPQLEGDFYNTFLKLRTNHATRTV